MAVKQFTEPRLELCAVGYPTWSDYLRIISVSSTSTLAPNFPYEVYYLHNMWCAELLLFTVSIFAVVNYNTARLS